MKEKKEICSNEKRSSLQSSKKKERLNLVNLIEKSFV